MAQVKTRAKKTTSKANSSDKVSKHEVGARKALLDELFYDISQSKWRIYWMNFFRGIFFGFGTVLGGTVLVAIAIWILSQFVDWFPIIGEYIQQIINSMEGSK